MNPNLKGVDYIIGQIQDLFSNLLIFGRTIAAEEKVDNFFSKVEPAANRFQNCQTLQINLNILTKMVGKGHQNLETQQVGVKISGSWRV